MGYSLDFSGVLTDQYLDWLASGIALTFLLATGGWILAFSMGAALAVLRATAFRPAVWVVSAFVEIHQNIPLLVQVLFWYFAIPEILPRFLQVWLNQNNSEFLLAMMAIAFCHSAYMSEAMRSGLRAVPPTQYEAARSFGFSYVAAMYHVVAPQALRHAVPPLINISLLLFKNTSIAMAIGVHELTYQGRLIESDTFRTFEVFLIITGLYLLFSFLIMIIGNRIEHRLQAGGR